MYITAEDEDRMGHPPDVGEKMPTERHVLKQVFEGMLQGERNHDSDAQGHHRFIGFSRTSQIHRRTNSCIGMLIAWKLDPRRNMSLCKSVGQ